MDPNKIGGNPFIPPDKLPIKKTETTKAQKANDDVDEKVRGQAGDDTALSGIFKLPPQKVVSKLSGLLERSLKDPKVEKLLTEFKVPSNSRQALALCTFSCLKDLLGKRFNLSSEEEKAIFDAIKNEFEEDSQKGQIDPDERKKRKRERRKKSKPLINAVMLLIDESMNKLESENKGLSLES